MASPTLNRGSVLIHNVLSVCAALVLSAFAAPAQTSPAKTPQPLARAASAQTPVATSERFKPELVIQTGHTGAVEAIPFSPDGRALASGGGDGSTRISAPKRANLERRW